MHVEDHYAWCQKKKVVWLDSSAFRKAKFMKITQNKFATEFSSALFQLTFVLQRGRLYDLHHLPYL